MTQLAEFHFLFSVQILFQLFPSVTFVLSGFYEVNQIILVEWTDTYGIHHLRILESSSRKLKWVEF